jgi:hypothetical protein
MSGGFFDYDQYRIERIADKIEQLIISNEQETMDGRFYQPEVIDKFKEGLLILQKAAIYTQRIDWLVSCDDDEDSFLDRLEEELSKLEKGV